MRVIVMIPYISGSPGCQSCVVLRKNDASDQFCVIEKWDSIEAHKASIAAFPKDKIAAAMPLFGAPPTGDYYEN
ncbi:MAG: antibiotic biosynthesis monooxygenase [Pseudomonadota bacterium]